MKSITIFGGCNTTTLCDELKNELSKIAKYISKDKYKIIYGGGSTGVMSVIPLLFNEYGGSVVSINAEIFLNELDLNIGEVQIYNSLEDRQQELMIRGDIFICLPGRIGTLSELCHILALNHTKIKNAPVYVYNYKGFFNDILAQIRKNNYCSKIIAFDSAVKAREI